MDPSNYDNSQEGTIIEDEGIPTSSNGLSIKQISLEQYRRCIVEGSKEMVRGGITTKINQGKPIEIEQPNQREIFRNCVRLFEVLLTPEIIKRKEIREELELNAKTTKEKFENFDRNKRKILEDMSKMSKEKAELTNWNVILRTLIDDHELDIVYLSQDKLIILSKLLSILHYYDEVSVMNG